MKMNADVCGVVWKFSVGKEVGDFSRVRECVMPFFVLE